MQFKNVETQISKILLLSAFKVIFEEKSMTFYLNNYFNGYLNEDYRLALQRVSICVFNY